MFQLIKISPSFNILSFSKGTEERKTQLAEFCHKFTCWHQGNLAQYYSLSNEYHKRMRISTGLRNPRKSRESKRELDNYLNSAYKNAWMNSVRLLQAFYDHKKSMKPRFCLKASDVDDRGENLIIDVFRDDGSTKPGRYKISENTGFQNCSDTGKYFICNDVPEAAKKTGYVNPRLDKKMVGNYKHPTRFEKKRRNGIDPKWAECWKDYKEGILKIHESAYKSTVITPMTLMGNDLDQRFLELTNLGKRAERYIFGFFCMDHVCANQFDDVDVAVSYIVADWLSLYQIPRNIFTILSETYNQIR